MEPNVAATEPGSEPVRVLARQLAVGDQIMGDHLPLGVPGRVIYLWPYTLNRSEWMFVAFIQRDGFVDSTTYLADAPIRIQNAAEPRVADPTGLAYTRADDEAEDPTPPGPREPMHTGAMTDEGLVDETAVGPVHMAYADGGTVCAASGAQSFLWTDVTCQDCKATA